MRKFIKSCLKKLNYSNIIRLLRKIVFDFSFFNCHNFVSFLPYFFVLQKMSQKIVHTLYNYK